jgi:hypothetical protein
MNAGGHGSQTQLTANRGPSTAKSPIAPNKPAGPGRHGPGYAGPDQHDAHIRKARQHQAPQPPANPGPSEPYLMYDSVTPSALPSGQPVAAYADGGYAASAPQLTGHSSVLWIDTNGTDPSANVLDVEPGDASPAVAAQWVDARLTEHPDSVAIVYTMLSDWEQVKDGVGDLPSWMQSHVRYWIADPTGVPHLVPGSSATQWDWGTSVDISTANPNFNG